MSYLQVVLAIVAFASSHREDLKSVWESLLKLYLAAREAAGNIARKVPDVVLPGDGVLQMLDTPDAATREAEAQLEALLAPDAVPGVEALKFPGGVSIREMIAFLRENPIGKAFLDSMLKRLGS